MNKRLFLFAAYDKEGIIDDSLIYYVSTLSTFGDVIVCMDCDCEKSETDKLKPYVVQIISKRHGEYDFGSYKRAYQYARDNDLLKDYDFVYLANDSVFGPLFDIKKLLQKMESVSKDAVGLVESKHKTHKFMESWFVRLNKTIFLSTWFDAFISSVTQEPDKDMVTIKYEHGLSNAIINNNCTWSGIYSVRGRKTYNNPKHLFVRGCPFVKKASFIRHNGALGGQIKYILKHANEDATQSVMTTANRIYGQKYMDWLLVCNPLKKLYRNITYAIKKLKKNEKN